MDKGECQGDKSIVSCTGDCLGYGKYPRVQHKSIADYQYVHPSIISPITFLNLIIECNDDGDCGIGQHCELPEGTCKFGKKIIHLSDMYDIYWIIFLLLFYYNFIFHLFFGEC